ncbi:MAG: hypothetical protein RL477_484 [Pseudomonadota bacterium]|jgi:2-keto-4-pentenoate hydratase/2-oxohepta-3-ene-1,7-dioic acid hydratase in catechol pathway
MKLVMLRSAEGVRAGALIGEGEVLDFAAASSILPIAGWLPGDVVAIIAGGDDGLGLARRVVDAVASDAGLRGRLREARALLAREQVVLASPLMRPSIVICAGQTFAEHHREMARRRGIENPEMPSEPRGFLKNINAIVGTDEAIVLPPEFPDKVDFEGELAIVIGRPCHRVSADEAMNYVAGYTILNDVSARDWAGGKGTRDQNLLGKQFPTFCPIGPAFVTADEFPDPDRTMKIETRLNGELMQSSGMDDLIFPMGAIVAHYARFYRLMPGDVVTTGTPSGAGHGRKPPVYMRAGDVVEVEVKGIGVLRNPIRATN